MSSKPTTIDTRKCMPKFRPLFRLQNNNTLRTTLRGWPNPNFSNIHLDNMNNELVVPLYCDSMLQGNGLLALSRCIISNAAIVVIKSCIMQAPIFCTLTSLAHGASCLQFEYIVECVICLQAVAPIRKKYDVLHMQSQFARVLSNDFCPVLPGVMQDRSTKRVDATIDVSVHAVAALLQHMDVYYITIVLLFLCSYWSTRTLSLSSASTCPSKRPTLSLLFMSRGCIANGEDATSLTQLRLVSI